MPTQKLLSLPLLFSVATFGIATLFANGNDASTPPEVAYPEGYREWRFVTSVVLQPKEKSTTPPLTDGKKPSPTTHGLIHNVYANDKALDGYRTGHFPEGAILIADWFYLKPSGAELVQGERKSINVMVRDARYTETGGWGFEDFDQDSRTIRNVGKNAVKSCFECHTMASDREFVFGSLKP